MNLGTFKKLLSLCGFPQQWTGSAAPSGSAGGGLAGTYPNPTVAVVRANIGSAAGPSMSFASYSSSGFYTLGGDVRVSVNGSAYARISGLGITAPGGGAFSFSSSTDVGASVDVLLGRENAGVLGQRNGSNPQEQRLYNTWTDSNNYERAYSRWTSNAFYIGTEALGSGSARSLGIISAFSLIFGAGNVNRWQIGTSGTLAPVSDVTYDFCANSTRAKNIYHAGVMVNGGWQNAVPTSGSTVSISNQSGYYRIKPAGPLAALTVQLPTPLGDGHEVTVLSTAAITAVTWTPVSGAMDPGVPTSLAASAHLKLKWHQSDVVWYAI